MRKILSTFFSLIIAAQLITAVSSCKDDEKPVFKVEDLYGTWKSESADEDGCYDIYTITEDLIVQSIDCGDGPYGETEYEYTYSNNTFTFNTILGEMKYAVRSLNTTSLTFEYSWLGQKIGTEKFIKQ